MTFNSFNRLLLTRNYAHFRRVHFLSLRGKEIYGVVIIPFPLLGGGKSEWWMERVGQMVWGTRFSREGKTGLTVVVVMVVVV